MPEPLFMDSKGREVVAPSFGDAALADTHAHLDMLEEPAVALARAGRAGIAFVATVADVTEDANRTYEELPSWLAQARRLLSESGHSEVEPPKVRIIVGAHPHNAKDYGCEAEQEMRRLAARPVTCALGELGLDYHYDHSPREVQRDRFQRHLGIAHELELPVVVHLREAHDDGLEILVRSGVPEAGAILHCYTSDAETLAPFLDLGCHVSFAGPVTFRKAEEIRAALKAVPAGRLLTETDCPFMAPEPFRGRQNEPALTVFTAAMMAKTRGEDPQSFAKRTYETAIALLDRRR